MFSEIISYCSDCNTSPTGLCSKHSHYKQYCHGYYYNKIWDDIPIEFRIEEKPPIRSIEQLNHFQCGKCSKWWSIGDAPKDKIMWYCPWCGQLNAYVEA